MRPFLPLKLGRRKLRSSSATCKGDYDGERAIGQCSNAETSPEPTETHMIMNGQDGSTFVQRLPLEIRFLVYQFLWRSHSKQVHIGYRKGHLFHAPCVMHRLDHDPDFINKQMDRECASPVPMSETGLNDRLRMWHRRQVDSWGYRHWRCEESSRFEGSEEMQPVLCDMRDTLGKRDFMSMMLICKRLHPEIMQSIFESHTFLVNDVDAAHRFLVLKPSPFTHHLRHLDLTLSACHAEYSPLGDPRAVAGRNRILPIIMSLSRLERLHDLRIAFDTWDRQYWIEVPEEGIMHGLKEVRALRKMVIELPARVQSTACGSPKDPGGIEIERRVLPRYGMVSGRLEPLTWHIPNEDDKSGCCWVSTTCIPYLTNPYEED